MTAGSLYAHRRLILLVVIVTLTLSLVTPQLSWLVDTPITARAQNGGGWSLYVYGPDDYTVENGETSQFGDDFDFGCYGAYGNQWGQGGSPGEGRYAWIEPDGSMHGGCHIKEGNNTDGRLIIGTISGQYDTASNTISNFRIESTEIISVVWEGKNTWSRSSYVIENAGGGKDTNSSDLNQYAATGKFSISFVDSDGNNFTKAGTVTVTVGIWPRGPAIQLDRTEAARFSAIKISGSGFKKQAATVKIYFNGTEIYQADIDSQGNLKIGMGDKTLWIWVPDDAPFGSNKVWAQVDETGEKSNEVSLNVVQVSHDRLLSNFDEIVKQYLATIPRNEAWYARFSPSGGWIWGGYGRNFVNGAGTFLAGALWLPTAVLTLGQYQDELWPNNKFVCSWYQREVLSFMDGIRFDSDPKRRALMDGFDYGPLNSGLVDVPAGAHYYVALWPHGPALDPGLASAGFPTTWEKGGISFDPWPRQAPDLFVLKAGSADWAASSVYSSRWTVSARYIYSFPRPEPPSIGYYKNKYPITGSKYYPQEKLANDYRSIVGIGAEPPKMLSTHSPVKLDFEDSSGNKAGLGADGMPYSNIPDLDILMIPKPEGGYEWYVTLPEGQIKTTITGTGDGAYQLKTKTSGQPIQEYPSVATKAGVSDEITLDDQPKPPALHTSDGRSLTPSAKPLPGEGQTSASPLEGNNALTLAMFGSGVLACLCLLGLALFGGVFLLRRKPPPSAPRPQPGYAQPARPAAPAPPPYRMPAQPAAAQPPIPPRLVVFQGAASCPWIYLKPGGVFIGRNVANALAIDDPGVSRQHARVDFADGTWMLTDLNSANGTFVNGIRITQKILFPGDRIQIGMVVLVFQF